MLTKDFKLPQVTIDEANRMFDDYQANPPVFFKDFGDIHLGGLKYQSSLDRLAGTPYITEESIGSGKVILFLQDPNYRLYWHGLTRLFLNSVILSPAFLQN